MPVAGQGDILPGNVRSHVCDGDSGGNRSVPRRCLDASVLKRSGVEKANKLKAMRPGRSETANGTEAKDLSAVSGYQQMLNAKKERR